MIRWNRSDYARLSQAVRQFNQKIQKLEHDERYILPQKANYQFLKENIETRAELTKTINDLKKFNPYNTLKYVEKKYGEKIPKWNPSSLAVLKEQSLKVLQKELVPDQLKFTVPTLGNESNQMILAQMKNIRNLNINSFIRKEREKLKRKADLKRKLKKQEIYKENYIKSLDNFQNLKGYDKLIKKLKSIPANKFFDMIDKGTDNINIKDPQYNSDYAGPLQVYFNDILETWGEILEAPDIQEYEIY